MQNNGNSGEPATTDAHQSETITALAVVVPLVAHPPRGFVMWLSLAQLISWGTLFYMFSLLLEHFEKDLSLSRVDAALAFSLALLTEGVLAMVVGRLIDAGRARAVMCAGSFFARVSTHKTITAVRWGASRPSVGPLKPQAIHA